jgi:MFS family permease
MLQTLRSREAAMPFIMLTVLIDMLAIGLIIPVLPALVGALSGNPADQVYWYGLAAMSFGLANFLASPVLGALSDKFGLHGPGRQLFWHGADTQFVGTDRRAHPGWCDAGQRRHCQCLCG